MYISDSNCGGLIYPPDGKDYNSEIKDKDPRMIFRAGKTSAEWHDIVFNSGSNPDQKAMENAETNLKEYIESLFFRNSTRI